MRADAFEYGGSSRMRKRKRERTSTTRIDQVARWEDLIGPVTKLVLIIQRLYRPCPTSRALAVARVS